MHQLILKSTSVAFVFFCKIPIAELIATCATPMTPSITTRPRNLTPEHFSTDCLLAPSEHQKRPSVTVLMRPERCLSKHLIPEEISEYVYCFFDTSISLTKSSFMISSPFRKVNCFDAIIFLLTSKSVTLS